MGERKGQNKYYPPDFDPKKHRSLDAYHGSHPLRERARKLGQGILIIRFEMPYNIWCDGCKNHIGMGVRYNAEKSKVGMYYTTPIYKFRMKCHLCDNHFEIKTDPGNHDYVIICGARRKEQRWDPKENEQIVPEDKNDQKKLALDAMYKLEHGKGDEVKGKDSKPRVFSLAASKQQWKDDYGLNRMMRDQFRVKKKAEKAEAERDQGLLDKYSLDLDLVPENASDKRVAELMQYRTVMSYEEKQKQTRNEIQNRPIFQSPKSGSSKALDSVGAFGIKSGKTSRHHLASSSPTDFGIVRTSNRIRKASPTSEDTSMDDNPSESTGENLPMDVLDTEKNDVENPRILHEDRANDGADKTIEVQCCEEMEPEASGSTSEKIGTTALSSLAMTYSDSSDADG